jgi:protein TonB
MTGRRDILDEHTALGPSLVKSLAIHGSLMLAAAGYSWLEGRHVERFGDPDSLAGGSTLITPVSKIPLPQRSGIVNPVANDTQSQAPAPPKPETVKTMRERADALELETLRKAEEKRKRDQRQSKSAYKPPEQRPNQVTSSTGAAAVSPMYGAQSAGGGVGIAEGNPFGNRFGYYASLIRQKVAENWRTGDLDPRIRTAPPVIVTFTVARDGRASDVRLIQGSGIPPLDYSCQRAVLDASPFPPLPAQYERNSATIEFWFQLKR